MSSFEVVSAELRTEPKTSPALLQILAADADSTTVKVVFSFRLPGESVERQMSLAQNPVELRTSPTGFSNEIEWSFSSEPGLPSDGSFVDDVQIIARLVSGTSTTETIQTITTGLGNDRPTVSIVDVSPESNGIVTVTLDLSDSSDDLCDVVIEFSEVTAGAPDWKLARPTGLGASTPTPDRAFQGVRAPRADPVRLTFSWDTNHLSQLPDLDRDIRVRVTPQDSVVVGVPVMTGDLRVNNNDEPSISIDQAAFALNVDQRRGIPIRFSVSDEEGDPVRSLFQWRREGETFVDIDSGLSFDALSERLNDPEWVRDHRVCEPYPVFARGQALRLDATHVVLPELRSREAWARTDSIEGLPIEFMRSSREPDLVSATWSANSLESVVAAIPTRQGTKALVLDARPAGAALVEVELETGAERVVSGSLPGLPTAMAPAANAGGVLVAVDLGGSWQLLEVNLSDGSFSALVTANGESARDIAALGTEAALATTGDALARLDWSGSAPATKRDIVQGLATPWGLAVDPVEPRRVWVAERDAVVPLGHGRVLEIDLLDASVQPVHTFFDPQSGPAFEGVTSIVYQPAGHRILAVCRQEGSTEFELRELSLQRDGNRSARISNLGSVRATISAGDDGLVLAARSSTAEILAIGGICARRTIAGFDLASCEVELDIPWAGTPGGASPWRIPMHRGFPTASSPGRGRTFTWDSRSVHVGNVFVRAIAFDVERGGSDESTSPIALSGRAAFKEVEVSFGVDFRATADFDEDGDLDLLAGNDVYFQDGARRFSLASGRLGSGGYLVGDIDGDGDTDVRAGQHVYLQVTPGQFDAGRIATESTSGIFESLNDLDGDGDLEIVQLIDDELLVHEQTAPGEFELFDAFTSHSEGTVVLGDVDSDGDIDVIGLSTSPERQIVISRGLPGLSFDEPDWTVPVVGDVFPRTYSIGDIDGNGLVDLLLARFQIPVTIHAAYQSMRGSFDFASIAEVPLGVPIQTIDLDGNGEQDVLANDGTVLFQMDGAFRPVATLTEAGATVERMRDIDGDGLRDLPVTFTSPGRKAVWFRKLGIESDPSRLSNSEPRLLELRSADLDADGDLDLVGTGTDALHVYLQLPTGGFTPAPFLVGSGEIAPRATSPIDIDGDGDVDLVTADLGSSRIAVFEQTEPASFTNTISVGGAGVTDELVTILPVDLDRDGLVDLVTTSDAGLVVFYQRPDRTFDAAPSIVDTASRAWYLRAADLDHDGYLDLVASNRSGSRFRVYRQGAPRVLVEQSTGLQQLVSGVLGFLLTEDIDGDGRLEVVTANSFGGEVHVYSQRAPFEFDADPVVLGSVTNTLFPLSGCAGDVDRDGDLDLVIGTAFGLAIFRQLSPGRFDPDPLIVDTNSEQWSALSSSDIDGDGEWDFVGVTDREVQIRWGGR